MSIFHVSGPAKEGVNLRATLFPIGGYAKDPTYESQELFDT